MRFLIVDAYYPAFIKSVYAQNPGLEQQAYSQQWDILMEQCFGTADFYSTNLQKIGHEATEVIANCRPIQWQWAKENRLSLPYRLKWRRYPPIPLPLPTRDWVYPILLAQVKAYRPDVIHFQDPNRTPTSFLREIRPYVRWITAQIASPISRGANFKEYDLMLSSFPHFVTRFQQQGVCSAYFNLGFDPKVLKRIRRIESNDVAFVGGISNAHAERVEWLEKIAKQSQIGWWGYGVEHLASSSTLRSMYRGQAWALDMYEKLYNARISLNHHINVSENNANNMRLYEATGVGTMLITDWKDNLADLFEPGKEVVAYRSPEECVELVQYYLEHEEERKSIAGAGQERTMREHTYSHRMQEFVKIIQNYSHRNRKENSPHG